MTDHTYDTSGNQISDANKKISLITYNYLNLAVEVSLTGKGTILYVYDADGDKLQKIVTEISTNPSKTTTTTHYCHGECFFLLRLGRDSGPQDMMLTPDMVTGLLAMGIKLSLVKILMGKE